MGTQSIRGLALLRFLQGVVSALQSQIHKPLPLPESGPEGSCPFPGKPPFFGIIQCPFNLQFDLKKKCKNGAIFGQIGVDRRESILNRC